MKTNKPRTEKQIIAGKENYVIMRLRLIQKIIEETVSDSSHINAFPNPSINVQLYKINGEANLAISKIKWQQKQRRK